MVFVYIHTSVPAKMQESLQWCSSVFQDKVESLIVDRYGCLTKHALPVRLVRLRHTLLHVKYIPRH